MWIAGDVEAQQAEVGKGASTDECLVPVVAAERRADLAALPERAEKLAQQAMPPLDIVRVHDVDPVREVLGSKGVSRELRVVREVQLPREHALAHRPCAFGHRASLQGRSEIDP